MIDTIWSIFFSIIKAHIFILIVLFLTYFIEVTTPLILFVKQFQWKKSPRNAEIHLNGDTAYYLIILLGFYFYEIYEDNVELSLNTFSLWVLMVLPVLTFFRKFYNKYQGVDPNIADDDYT